MMGVFEPELHSKVSLGLVLLAQCGAQYVHQRKSCFEFPNVNFAQLRRKEIEILQNNSHMSEAPQQLKLDWQ